MSANAIVFFRVDGLDIETKSASFTIGRDPTTYAAAGGFELVRDAIKALQGERVIEMKAVHRQVGEVTEVQVDEARQRLELVATISSLPVWKKVVERIYKGGRVQLYGQGPMSQAGRLMLVDRPDPADVVLRHASAPASAALGLLEDEIMADGRLNRAVAAELARIEKQLDRFDEALERIDEALAPVEQTVNRSWRKHLQ